MTTPGSAPQLVEHFFRHESGKMIAVLTRAFGVVNLDLIEDKVQEALVVAVESWGRKGVPGNPSGWIYRVARHRILDALRREKAHRRAVEDMGFARDLAGDADSGSSNAGDWQPTFELSDEKVPDSLLRMIFVCCHPALDRRSQIALTLKILGGFSLAEIASGLLISAEAAKKRVQRAKKTLAEENIDIELPSAGELEVRLCAVHEVLYLLFNEGYSTSQGTAPLRDDICEEAARLCHLLCEHAPFSTAETRALMALMAAHAARLPARVDGAGAVILLADQDRSAWDRRLIGSADFWFERSKTDRPSRFHYEAAIALAHVHAPSLSKTDWSLIVGLYDRLLRIHPSPLYILNRAIARGEMGEVERALGEIESIRASPEMHAYPRLDCAVGRLHELSGRGAQAIEAYGAALEIVAAPHERVWVEGKLAGLRKRELGQGAEGRGSMTE